MLAHHQKAIRVAQALRTVILVSPDAVSVAQSPAPAAPSVSAPQAAKG